MLGRLIISNLFTPEGRASPGRFAVKSVSPMPEPFLRGEVAVGDGTGPFDPGLSGLPGG